MYMVKSLGNESENKKILARLRKRIVWDITKVRQQNLTEVNKVVLDGKVLKCIDEKGQQFNLVKSNKWIDEKGISANWIKRNWSLLV